MSSTDLTLSEMGDSLTGFDEIAVTTHLGYDVYDVAATGTVGGSVRFARALIFIHQTRAGLAAPDAKKAALTMSGAAVNGYFATDPEELDADDPDTAVGKGDSPLVAEPLESPSSAS